MIADENRDFAIKTFFYPSPLHCSVMPIELRHPAHWQKAISAISTFINEGNVRFNNQGIFFKAMDPSQIVLVDYFMEKKQFDQFSVEPSFVGIDLVELNKAMQRANSDDRLVMELSDNELTLQLDGELSRKFHLPLIDVNQDDVNAPNPHYDAFIQISGRVLKEALKDATLFGTSVVFKVKNNSFWIEARGNNGALKTVARDPKSISVKSNSEITAKYSLTFLQNIVKEADPDKKISIELKSDAPAKISYPIGETTITFYLAHMIL